MPGRPTSPLQPAMLKASRTGMAAAAGAAPRWEPEARTQSNKGMTGGPSALMAIWAVLLRCGERSKWLCTKLRVPGQRCKCTAVSQLAFQAAPTRDGRN